MNRYIAKRILIILPTFFGITALVYFLANLMPGDPLDLLLNNPDITEAEIERQRVALGLNRNVVVRYFSWLGEFLQGHIGYSFRTGRPVFEMITERLQNTLLLSLSALALSLIIAVPLGIIAANKPYSVWDYISSGIAFLFTSTPGFFMGIVFVYFFVIKINILPLSGMYDSYGAKTLVSLLRHMVMPACVLAVQYVGETTRYMRSVMIGVLNEDYIRTARAKGMRHGAVIRNHALKNSLIPVVTNVGMSLPSLLGGAIIIEKIFTWPGIGSLMFQSISSRDYPVIMGISAMVSVVVLAGNLALDLVYGLLDPRITYR
jgi:peptide/nickel transport system permease protein